MNEKEKGATPPMKRSSPPIKHQQRLADATSTVDLFELYQNSNRAGKENHALRTCQNL